MTGDVSKNMATGENVTNAHSVAGPERLHRRHHPASQSVPGLYQWVAWKTAPGEMKVGTYTGNGRSSQSITGLGFNPDIVFVLSGAPTNPCTECAPGQPRTRSRSQARCPPTYIPTLGADGFTVGTDVRVNRSGTTYHYVAWNEIAGKVDVGTYTGDWR